MLTVQLCRVRGNEDLALPAKMSTGASGFDLCAAVTEELVLQPGEWKLVPTGISIAMPEHLEAQVRPRSGLAFKHGITMLNSPGTIDADYRGEIKVIMVNFGDHPFRVNRGDRIAQLVFQEVAKVQLEQVDELVSSARGAGGFGHTGV
ncbi:dUTP diphosphatase [Shimazuella sp. AN120528]|uniref:dUTP diphosphatase n=1 Tax=Shimazuella soli TaxID=1892854 RepID=UPI001F0DACD8|nr:dUTP diphosphatase [Shimazuella soli]MCH5586262.1 dUTP diphosphatase [Shimazuella soli]